jgi:hypothetical protein
LKNAIQRKPKNGLCPSEGFKNSSQEAKNTGMMPVFRKMLNKAILALSVIP